jgi:hypothetical protein
MDDNSYPDPGAETGSHTEHPEHPKRPEHFGHAAPSLPPNPAVTPVPSAEPAPFPQVSAMPVTPPAEPPKSPGGIVPQPVVKVLSPRGVEYVFLTIALFTGAIGLASALISLVNGKTDFSVLAFPAATLLVSVPVFAWLFLRLKKAELANPSLQLDPSKRRSTQFTQIFSFIVSFFTLIGCVSFIFAKMAGQYNGSILKVILDVLVILLVAGGILVYYWRDEHR